MKQVSQFEDRVIKPKKIPLLVIHIKTNKPFLISNSL